MLIRLAKHEDFNDIYTLSNELSPNTISLETNVEILTSILKSENDQLWVTSINEEIIGWIHFFKTKRVSTKEFVEIGGLIVSSKHRKKGIGKSMINLAIDWARENDMALRVRCNKKRENTHLFYKSLKFIEIKEQKVFDLKAELVE